jgi:hypothetical protein
VEPVAVHARAQYPWRRLRFMPARRPKRNGTKAMVAVHAATADSSK